MGAGAACQLAKGKGLAETIASARDKNGNGALHYAASGVCTLICHYLIDDLEFDPNLSSLTGFLEYLTYFLSSKM